MLRVILPVVIGAGVGAVVGHLSRCAGGTCPLMCAWWRGAIYGAVLGLMFGLSRSR
jgi:hypothetical protein